MTTIMPQSELTRKAVAWISDMREASPEKSLLMLIEEAAMRFNLGPKDVDWLQRFFMDKKD